MDIAVSGLLPLSMPGLDRARQSRPQSDTQNTPQNRPDRQPSNQNPASSSDRQQRVIGGEVVSRSNLDSSRQTSNTQRSLSERALSFSQQGSRQYSVPAAIQAFKENEALIAPEGLQRQVSGIIDEYV